MSTRGPSSDSFVTFLRSVHTVEQREKQKTRAVDQVFSAARQPGSDGGTRITADELNKAVLALAKANDNFELTGEDFRILSEQWEKVKSDAGADASSEYQELMEKYGRLSLRNLFSVLGDGSG